LKTAFLKKYDTHVPLGIPRVIATINGKVHTLGTDGLQKLLSFEPFVSENMI